MNLRQRRELGVLLGGRSASERMYRDAITHGTISPAREAPTITRRFVGAARTVRSFLRSLAGR